MTLLKKNDRPIFITYENKKSYALYHFIQIYSFSYKTPIFCNISLFYINKQVKGDKIK